MFSEIIAKVEGAEKTFVGWIAKEYKALYSKEPEIEQVVDATIDYVEPALVIVLDAVGAGGLTPEVVSVINEAQADLKVVSALIYDFGPTPTAASIAASVASNLASIESAGHIKDTATQAKFALIVKAVGTLATSIANLVASQAAKSAQAA